MIPYSISRDNCKMLFSFKALVCDAILTPRGDYSKTVSLFSNVLSLSGTLCVSNYVITGQEI